MIERSVDETKVFVFWPHSTAPFVLGSEGVMREDGAIILAGSTYGGMVIGRARVIAIYPVELGRQILKQVEAAGEAYYNAVRSAEAAVKAAVVNIIPELKHTL